MAKFRFVSGLDPVRAQAAEDKQAQEARAMHERVRRYGGNTAERAYQEMPMPGDEDSPETHQALMQRGRDLLDPYQDEVDADFEDEANDHRDDMRIEAPRLDVPPGMFDSVIAGAAPLPSHASVMADARSPGPGQGAGVPMRPPRPRPDPRANTGVPTSDMFAMAGAPEARGDGIDQIGSYADQLLARARARAQASRGRR